MFFCGVLCRSGWGIRGQPTASSRTAASCISLALLITATQLQAQERPRGAPITTCPALGLTPRTTLHFSPRLPRFLNKLHLLKSHGFGSPSGFRRNTGCLFFFHNTPVIFLPAATPLFSARSELFFCTTLLPKWQPVLQPVQMKYL